MPNDPESINALKHNWRAEVETSRVYRDLAKRETDQKRTSILLRMAEAEERHATRWAQKLTELGMEPPVLKDSLGQRLNRWWNRVAGLDVAIRRMEAAEDRHEARYRAQSERALADDPDAQKFLRVAALEEKARSGGDIQSWPGLRRDGVTRSLCHPESGSCRTRDLTSALTLPRSITRSRQATRDLCLLRNNW